jgi:hypothetical protein
METGDLIFSKSLDAVSSRDCILEAFSSSWEEPLFDPKDLLISFLGSDRPWMLNGGRPSTLLNI